MFSTRFLVRNFKMLIIVCDKRLINYPCKSCLFLQFFQVITLPGHEDWVRAVDFTVDGKSLHILK